MKEHANNSQYLGGDGTINIGALIRLLFLQSKLILFCIFFASLCSTLYYVFAEKTYRVSSLVQVFPNESPSLNTGTAIDLYLGGTNTSDIDSITEIYKSRNNLLPLIEELNLNIEINGLNHKDKKFHQYFLKIVLPGFL